MVGVKQLASSKYKSIKQEMGEMYTMNGYDKKDI